MSQFKNVIFDLDGLIVDTEPLHLRALNAFMQTTGATHQFEPTEYGKNFTGRPILENAEYLRVRFALTHTADQISYAHRTVFDELIQNAHNLVPMAGLYELLGWLVEKNFRVAIASSSRPAQVELIVRNLNLQPHFQAIIGNDGSMQPKPAPDVYLRALQQLGANPNETLALEDSNSGVGAAHAAGLFVIAIPNEFTRHQDLAHANLVMKDLRQVRRFLQKEER